MKSIFPVVPARVLVQKLQVGIYLDDPDRMCSLMMGTIKDNYCVPIEVARIIYKQIGNAISKAEAINEYKITVGCNPTWPYNV